MAATLRVGLVQCDVAPGDPVANLAALRDPVDRAAHAGCDLVVLPELVDVGYDLANAAAVARSEACRGFAAGLGELAAAHATWLVAGVTEVDGDHVFDVATAIAPDGATVATYRKAHLFTPTGEDAAFARGDELVVVTCGEVRLGLAICYDLRFPEQLRALALAGATVVAVPSAFPVPRADQWRTLLAARALENQLFVVAANRVGTDAGTTFCGTSAVASPLGTLLHCAEAAGEDLLVATLDLASVEAARSAIPALRSRREDVYDARVRVVGDD